MRDFFKESAHISVLMRFKNKIDGFPKGSDFERQRDLIIKLVINSMLTNPRDWDKVCQINIEFRGDSLIEKLNHGGDQFSKSFLDEICAVLFRFLFEYYLSTNKEEFPDDFESSRIYIIENIDSFDSDAKGQIEYAIRQMPISIFKQIANSEGISSIKDFNSTFSNVQKMKNEWDVELDKKEKQINVLRDSLNKYENAFNFVGLFQGFDELCTQKIAERDNLLFWLRVLASLVLVPVLIEFFLIVSNFKDIASVKEGLLISFLPAFSLILIIIFYFKILLANYKSVKAQLLQIDLRKTLCRFIQHYSEYSSQIKKQDPESLVKFENIIFSGLVNDEGALPSAYDGIEQIANLIKSIKS